jgi:hypothetical protein
LDFLEPLPVPKRRENIREQPEKEIKKKGPNLINYNPNVVNPIDRSIRDTFCKVIKFVDFSEKGTEN